MVLFQLGRFVDLFPWVREISAPIEPRYNLAPTQSVAAMLNDDSGVIRSLRWGLIPGWARDPSVGSRLINARVETAAVKPTFKRALARRRCIVFADGFYEWKKHEASKYKTPMFIHPTDDKPFLFAGLWEKWKDESGQIVHSCAVMTSEPNELMATIHNRMPVIFDEDHARQWLDAREHDPQEMARLAGPYPAHRMRAYPVARAVNSVAHEGSRLIEPVENPESPLPAISHATRRSKRVSNPAQPGLFDL